MESVHIMSREVWIIITCFCYIIHAGPHMTHPFRFTGRLRSFRFASVGLWTMLRTQHNAWVHAAATLVVITTGLSLRIAAIDWCLIVLSIMAVWSAEALNTAFEFLADVASPEYHPTVKHAKDVAAAAVLIAAIGSVAIGLLVFGPGLAGLFR